MQGRFTERARKVLALARDEAKRFNHDYIGTEHILLGLIREGEGVGAEVLINLGLSLGAIRGELLKIVKPNPTTTLSALPPFTPASEKLIEFAMDEAKAMSHNYVGTEHLLLGLIRVENEISSKVLLGLGVNADRVRQETINMLEISSPASERLKETCGELRQDTGKLIAEAEESIKLARTIALANPTQEYYVLNALYLQNQAVIGLLKQILEKKE